MLGEIVHESSETSNDHAIEQVHVVLEEKEQELERAQEDLEFGTMFPKPISVMIRSIL